MKDDILAEVESGPSEGLSLRQQGKLKHKKALLAKLQKSESRPSSPAAPATPSEEPEQKKIKQGHKASRNQMNDVCE